MIYEYPPADEAEVIDCIMELQAAESKIEPIRISNRNIADMYFKEIQIRNIRTGEQIPYGLLLLSDDTTEAIDKNLHNGELFVGEIGSETVAAFVLKVIQKDTIEIKNIAVKEGLQGTGIGTYLLEYIKKIAKNRRFETLLVGTCDQCTKEITFYKKTGFNITGLRKNFFIDNYQEPIFENGIQIKDMVMLSIDFNN